MDDEPLGIDEDVTLVEGAPEEGLASTVTTASDVELELSVIG